MFKLIYVLAFSLFVTSQTALAACQNSWSIIASACQHVSDTWTQGDNDLYLPLHAHHLRFAYTDEKIDSFNENSLGLGYGRSRYVNGNWEGLYGMAFLDSHNDIEPMLGYAYQWMWGQQNAFHAGLGYTVFMTARSDVMHYTPIPGALPIASINYNKVSLNGTYVPGGKGNGNILFFWSRIGF
jgi:lipid IVA palmitoyltransferase